MMIVLNKYILLNLFNCTGHILYYTIHIIMQYNVKITKIIINIGHKNNDKIKISLSFVKMTNDKIWKK